MVDSRGALIDGATDRIRCAHDIAGGWAIAAMHLYYLFVCGAVVCASYSWRVASGPGKISGTSNGDPTRHVALPLHRSVGVALDSNAPQS